MTTRHTWITIQKGCSKHSSDTAGQQVIFCYIRIFYSKYKMLCRAGRAKDYIGKYSDGATVRRPTLARSTNRQDQSGGLLCKGDDRPIHIPPLLTKDLLPGVQSLECFRRLLDQPNKCHSMQRIPLLTSSSSRQLWRCDPCSSALCHLATQQGPHRSLTNRNGCARCQLWRLLGRGLRWRIRKD